MISALGASSVFLSTNSKTSSAKFSSSVTKKQDALGSCSACDNMSVAIYSEVIRASYGTAAALSSILTFTTIISLLIFFKLTGSRDISL